MNDLDELAARAQVTGLPLGEVLWLIERCRRWPEAVEKVRCLVKPDSQWSECLDFLVEEVERLKEES